MFNTYLFSTFTFKIEIFFSKYSIVLTYYLQQHETRIEAQHLYWWNHQIYW